MLGILLNKNRSKTLIVLLLLLVVTLIICINFLIVL
jgi:maltodextrin utilization protein YvdJ